MLKNAWFGSSAYSELLQGLPFPLGDRHPVANEIGVLLLLSEALRRCHRDYHDCGGFVVATRLAVDVEKGFVARRGIFTHNYGNAASAVGDNGSVDVGDKVPCAFVHRIQRERCIESPGPFLYNSWYISSVT